MQVQLATALGVRPEELELDVDERGKPFVHRPATDLSFSVTHTAGMTVVALACGGEVGVDAEPLDRDVEGWTLWRHALSERERASLGEQPPTRNTTLLRAWVRKEALLKAAGVGLAVEPVTVELSAAGRIVALPASLGPPSAWSLHDVALPGYAVAVACRPAARSLVVAHAAVPR